MRLLSVALALLCAACVSRGASDGEETGSTESGAVERCEDQLTQSACEGLLLPEEGDVPLQCEWVDVWSSPGPCEEGTSQAQCLTFSNPGAGCGEGIGCGRIFVRDAGEAGVQIVKAEICGLDPEPDWDECVLDEMGNVTPHPACACGC